MLSAISRAPSAPRIWRPPCSGAAAGSGGGASTGAGASGSGCTSGGASSAAPSMVGCSTSAGAASSGAGAQVREKLIDLGLHAAGALEDLLSGLLGLAHAVHSVGVGLLARLTGAVRGVVGDPAGLLLGLRLDVGRAVLGGLDDRANLVRGRGRERCGRWLLLALQLRHGVRDLAEVTVDLVRVVPAPCGGEVVSLDVITVEFQEVSPASVPQSARSVAQRRTARQPLGPTLPPTL